MPGPLFWFFAIVGLVTLVTAIRFAFRPQERLLAILRALSAATVFASLTGFLAGATNGLVALNRWLAHAPDVAPRAEFWPKVVTHFAEMPIPLVLGFALLSVVWLLVAVGLRRQV